MEDNERNKSRYWDNLAGSEHGLGVYHNILLPSLPLFTSHLLCNPQPIALDYNDSVDLRVMKLSEPFQHLSCGGVPS